MSDKKRLGDVVESVIKAVMPKTAARAQKEGCGCAKRKANLNELDKLIRG